MRITRHIALLFMGFFVLLGTAGQSQTQLVTTPNASPKAKVVQEIGLTKVKVIFYRPAVQERDVWTELVPDGAVWRAGANDNTVIAFSEPVRIEGRELPAGRYGFHILPEGEQATLIFSRNTSSWGSFSYQEEEDALRVKVPVKKIDHHVERLDFEFYDLSDRSATCALVWEKRAFPFRIETPTEEIVVASLEDELRNKAGWSWKGWMEAARWCLQNETHLEKGLQWAGRSVFMQPNPQNLIVKAKLRGMIEGAGDKEETARAAMASLAADLEQFPVTWREYNAAATFAMQQGQVDQAMVWSDQSIKDEENMPALLVHSQVLRKAGQEEKAQKARKRGLEIGTNAQLNTYGYQLLFSGKVDEAIEVFLKNTEKHPEDPNVWDSLGEGYYTQGDYEKAIPALKKSLSLDPPDNVRANSLKLLSQMGVKTDGPHSNQ